MKKFLFVFFCLFSILLSFDCSAVWVKGYYRKNGTYVVPHYRSAPRLRGGYGGGYYAVPALAATGATLAAVGTNATVQEEKVVHGELVATPATNNALNQRWLEYYKSAAMIVGDLSNLGKVEYICKYQETEPLWETVEEDYSFCQDRGCFVEKITRDYVWKGLNKKIDNIYNYLKKAEEK